MTPQEQAAIRALLEIEYGRRIGSRRVIESLARRNRRAPLTEIQRASLWSIAWKFRRQLPEHVQAAAQELRAWCGEFWAAREEAALAKWHQEREEERKFSADQAAFRAAQGNLFEEASL